MTEARTHPCTGFIGAEPFVNGMAKALAAIAAGTSRTSGSIMAMQRSLWPGCPGLARARRSHLSRPLAETRHWNDVSCRTKASPQSPRYPAAGREFRFASDIPDYAAWTLNHLIRSPILHGRGACRRLAPGVAGLFRTRYEAKAKREGRAPCYLIFRKTDDPSPEA